MWHILTFAPLASEKSNYNALECLLFFYFPKEINDINTFIEQIIIKLTNKLKI